MNNKDSYKKSYEISILIVGIADVVAFLLISLPLLWSIISILIFTIILVYVWFKDLEDIVKQIIFSLLSICLLGLLFYFFRVEICLTFCEEENCHYLRKQHLTIEKVNFEINDSRPAVVANRGDIIPLKTGDKLCLVDFTYKSTIQGNSNEIVQGEAYIRKGGKTEKDIDYEDGRFTKEAPIEQGPHHIGDFIYDENFKSTPCWIAEPDWNAVSVQLVHYYYPDSHKVDDKILFNIGIN